MNARELRAKDDDELRKELLGLHREAFNLRMQKGMGQMFRSSQVKRVRRDIARLKMILSERERP
ncbi:MAG: 50S ribosomal protein L29 [Thiotrichales bacterium]|nr:50S ribosomal protein L29 [Thiotrichales bacterium]MCY4285106.1 50S ribosomal protein L29 [Thiotrichales bacterium]MCY4351057.1 50S ribosomal protein L29 [Thiotrichales bacterium]